MQYDKEHHIVTVQFSHTIMIHLLQLILQFTISGIKISVILSFSSYTQYVKRESIVINRKKISSLMNPHGGYVLEFKKKD